MFKIVGSLPVKTRLPLKAWVLAGLVNTVLISNIADARRPTNYTGSKFGNGALRLATDLTNLFAAL